MKRTVVMLATAAIVLSTVAPASARKSNGIPRTERGEYIAALGTTGVGVTWDSPAGSLTEVNFPVQPKEKTVSIEIVDDSGFPTGGVVTFDVDGDGVSDTDAIPFCGKTEAPLLVEGAELQVRVGTGPCGDDNSVVVATSGEVVATFSKSR